MFLSSFFNNNKTFTATIQLRTQTNTNGTLGPITWPDSKKFQCIQWYGSMSDSLISQKVRADVSAIIICKPSDIKMSEIPDDSRIKLEDGTELLGYFSVIKADNIARQDKVLMIPLKEYTA